MESTSTDALAVESAGEGPPLLLIHGSATDRTTWSIQWASLTPRLRLLRYDRRLSSAPTVTGHAEDAAQIIRQHAGGSAFVCGQSFGAVVALELLARHPSLVRGAVLMEPPLPVDEEGRRAAEALVRQFEETRAREGGPAAAELFLRAVLSDELYEKVPRPFQERARAMHEAIAQDCRALVTYRLSHTALSAVQPPALLLGGDRSASLYGATLAKLESLLPNARRELLSPAGHMMHAEAARRFNAVVVEFVASVSGDSSPPSASHGRTGE